MTLDIFAGIDGTGTANDWEYTRAFAKSCVRELYDTWHQKNVAHYSRGPTNLDFTVSTRFLSQAAYGFVTQQWDAAIASGVQPRVFVAGYSRGASAGIDLCKRLDGKGIPVHCLLLYDAVDMTYNLSFLNISRNVDYCFHALRAESTNSRPSWKRVGLRRETVSDLQSEKMLRAGLEAAKGAALGAAMVGGRMVAAAMGAFQNRTIDIGKRGQLHFDREIERREFLCTHGGAGGTPWTNEAIQKEGLGLDNRDCIREPYPPQVLKSAAQKGITTGTLMPLKTDDPWIQTNVKVQDDEAQSQEVRRWMKRNRDIALGAPQLDGLSCPA